MRSGCSKLRATCYDSGVREPLSRARLAAFLAATLVVGALSRTVHAGFWPWDKSLGDVLNAVAAFLAIALVVPRARLWVLAGISLAACIAIELFQLTALEQGLAARHRAVAILLGTTFAWHDLACYAI